MRTIGILVALLGGLSTGCVPPTTAAPSEVFVGDRGGGGELEVRWNLDAARSLLAPSVAQSADTYQLVAFSGTTTTLRLLKPGLTNVLSLAPGTWKIVLLAGLKRSATSTTVFLVGAASDDAVVISQGVRTAVFLTLKAIDTSFEVSGTGVWGDDVVVRATGKSRNPSVGVFLAESSADRHPRFRSLELWNGYKDPVVTGTPVDWSAEVTTTIPEGGTEVAAWLVGPQLCLLDGTGSWVPAQGILDGSWEWLNRADMTDTHVLAAESERHMATSAPPTGLNITIGWE